MSMGVCSLASQCWDGQWAGPLAASQLVKTQSSVRMSEAAKYHRLHSVCGVQVAAPVVVPAAGAGGEGRRNEGGEHSQATEHGSFNESCSLQVDLTYKTLFES